MQGPEAPTRAVIDIGTNSVKLLVAELRQGQVHPLMEESTQTRLGRGFYETHVLRPEAISQTAAAVADFADRSRRLARVEPRVLATSAARDALNRRDLLAAVREASGLDVRVISGQEEAEYVFRGVATDPELSKLRLLILDVGGGSTEVILGVGGHHTFRQSFPLGSVRLMEQLQPSEPPTGADLRACRQWLKEFFEREMTDVLESYLAGSEEPACLVGTGGTATILARMEGGMEEFNRRGIERVVLSRGDVMKWMEQLWGRPLAERQQIVGLPKKRADIVLMGVGIFEAVMEHFDLNELRVSARGLRFGAVMEQR